MVQLAGVLVSALVSLIVSVAVSYLSHILSKQRNKDMESEQWVRDVKRICNQIHRDALSLDPGVEVEVNDLTREDAVNSELTTLSSSIQNLEELSSDPIGNQRHQNLVQEIDELTGWCRSPNYQGDDLTTTDVQQKILNQTQDIISMIESK
ncbi:hypothetical protein [Natrinema altunense]|uniref:hypothetical protein n=1 Tax=Natrinema altunense TaxID=222984 RepID=UPI0011868680|nr:hypothetical protein [Natrinema altunense]